MTRPFSALSALFTLLAFNLTASPRSFDLTTLTAADTFTAERGYGFDLGTTPDAIGSSTLYFSVAVPEGNWRVTVTLGDPAVASVNTIKAESRRLMLEQLATQPGEIVTRSFIVNVRNRSLVPPEKNAPGGTQVLTNDREEGSLTWDDKLTLEFAAGARVRAIALEPAEVPTVYLAGDSTVTDQRWEDGASWGQMLTRFFGAGIAIANHAESGETLKSFTTGLRLAKVLERMRPGDWFLIQFGHNDQKQQWPQTYVEANTTYQAWLRAFIAEARRRGATPVLVTSPQRRTFDEHGRIRNTHGDYPAAVRAVAAAEGVALINLEAASRALYEALGPEQSPRLFANGGKDATHHNNLGAYLLAQAVAQSLRDQNSPLAQHLAGDLPPFDPAHPGNPDDFKLPASPQRSTIAPRGN